MEEFKNYKIEMTPREFELLHEITQYAISQMITYLMCLIRSKHGRDEAKIRETSAKLVSFQIFQESITTTQED